MHAIKALTLLTVLQCNLRVGTSFSLLDDSSERRNSLPTCDPSSDAKEAFSSRRTFLASVAATTNLFIPFLLHVSAANAKCKDIESCREIGEKKDAELVAANPVTKLGQGLQYKVLYTGLGDESVTDESKVQITYSISQSNGSYMYSKGFGFNKMDLGDGRKVSDLGLDTLLINMSETKETKIPVGIRQAILGMRRGERRRIQCPPALGFETSDWNPQPTTFRGKQQIKDYQSTLFGRGDLQPAFAAPTIWDVEVVSIRN